MSHTELDDEIEASQKLELDLEQLRADMALLKAENMTYTQYGSCQDCGFPLDKTDDDDIVCHKCGEEIGDRMIADRNKIILELEFTVSKARELIRMELNREDNIGEYHDALMDWLTKYPAPLTESKEQIG